MPDVNYISHLNAVFAAFEKDSRLNPTHISLYMALFQIWNHYRFRESFHINREEVMQLAKIGSKSTYHRCLKQMHHYNYLVYNPSHNPFKGSSITMLPFRNQHNKATSTVPKQVQPPEQPNKLPVPDSGQPVYPAVSKTGQAVVPKDKQDINLKTGAKLPKPESQAQTIEFFKKENWPLTEAEKFFNHYQSIGWKIRGQIPIEDWHATARNWMIKSKEIKRKNELSQNQYNQSATHQDNHSAKETTGGHLHTPRNKNYNKPL